MIHSVFAWMLLLLLPAAQATPPLIGAPVECAISDSIRYALNVVTGQSPQKTSQARSSWGHSKQVKAWNRGLEYLEYKHSVQNIRIQPGSLAEKNERLIAVLDDINYYNMDEKVFIEQLMNNHKRQPLVKDFKKFYQTRLELFQDGIYELAYNLSDSHPQLSSQIGVQFGKELQTRIDHFSRLAGNPKVMFDDLVKEAALNNQKLGSILSELYIAFTVPGVRKLGMRLSEHTYVNKLLGVKLKEFSQTIQDDVKWAILTEKYPAVFGNRLLLQKNSTRGGTLQNISMWVKDKEIDVVRAQDGKQIWVEVKKNKLPFTLKTFENPKWAGGKSVKQQLQEDLEIIRMLGIEKEIKVEFAALGGMSEEVARELKRMGISIVPNGGLPSVGTP